MKWIKNLDILSPSVGLNVDGRSTMTTHVGSMLSIGYVAVIITLAVFQSLSNFDSTSPTIAREESETSEYPVFDLKDSKTFPVIYVFENSIQNLPVEKVPSLLTFIYTKVSYKYIDKGDGTYTVGMEPPVMMPVVPCRDIMNDPKYFAHYKMHENNTYFKRFGSKFGLCVKVDATQTTVQGGVGDPKLDFITLRVFPCIGIAGLNCEANAAFLKQITYTVALPSTSMNLSNYENPISSFPSTDMLYYVNEGQRYQYTMKLSQTEIYDDPGMYYPLRRRIKYSQIDKVTVSSRTRDGSLTCSPAAFSSGACIPFALFDFMSGSKKVKLTRYYKGIVETLGDVGGLNSMVLIIFIYLNLFYLQLIKKKMLTKMVFPFLGESIFDAPDSGSGTCGKICAKLKSTCCKKNKRTVTRAKTGLATLHIDKKEVKKLQEEAYKVIDTNLDIVALIREISNLKVLTHMILKDYQQKLVPLISLGIQYKLDGITTPIGDEKFSRFLENGIAREISTMSALRQLQQSLQDEMDDDAKGDNRDLESNIDYFCMQSLVNGGGIFVNVLKHSFEMNRSSSEMNSPTKTPLKKLSFIQPKIKGESSSATAMKPKSIQRIDL